MYYRSPMENFNKSNPFIIIAKKNYYNLIDDIQEFSRECIITQIYNGILALIAIGLEIYVMITHHYFITSGIIIASIIAMNISIFLLFKKELRYFMSENSAFQEFSRLSEMELNQILTLNNEDVLKCINQLYELKGEFTVTRKKYRTTGWILITTIYSVAAIFISIMEIIF